jgi:hypothetical protein
MGNPLHNYIIWRVKKNKNAIVVWNGPTGCGKTYGAIGDCYELARLLGTNFSVKANVDFRFDKMLEKMALPENQKPGTCFVFEEIGVTGGGGSSREWQSKVNRFFFSFLQTARHRNQVLMFTCPHFSFLEKGSRTLVHLQMTSDRIDFKKKLSYWHPYYLQTNQKTGKTYFKYLRVKTDGVSCKYKTHTVVLLPQEVIEEYEKLKTDFTTGLYKQARELEAPKRQVGKVDKEMAIAMVNNGVDMGKIASHFGVTKEAIQKMCKRADKKALEGGNQPFLLENGRFQTDRRNIADDTT